MENEAFFIFPAAPVTDASTFRADAPVALAVVGGGTTVPCGFGFSGGMGVGHACGAFGARRRRLLGAAVNTTPPCPAKTPCECRGRQPNSD